MRNPTAQVRRINNEDLSEIISDFVNHLLEFIEGEERTPELKNEALENLYFLLKFAHRIRVFSKISINPLGYNPEEIPFLFKIVLSEEVKEKFRNEKVWRSLLGNGISYAKKNK